MSLELETSAGKARFIASYSFDFGPFDRFFHDADRVGESCRDAHRSEPCRSLCGGRCAGVSSQRGPILFVPSLRESGQRESAIGVDGGSGFHLRARWHNRYLCSFHF